jgi:hypothetical protein
METYRLTASALLRLAAIASQAPGVDADEVVSLVQSAVPIAPLVPEHVELAPGDDETGPTKPAKPE